MARSLRGKIKAATVKIIGKDHQSANRGAIWWQKLTVFLV